MFSTQVNVFPLLEIYAVFANAINGKVGLIYTFVYHQPHFHRFLITILAVGCLHNTKNRIPNKTSPSGGFDV